MLFCQKKELFVLFTDSRWDNTFEPSWIFGWNVVQNIFVSVSGNSKVETIELNPPHGHF